MKNEKETETAGKSAAFAAFADLMEKMKRMMDAHGARGLILALMWPVALFGTIIALTLIITSAGAFWPLCAFVMPLTVLLLFAGPRLPGSRQ